MTDSLWRLVWALPLVLVTGAAAILVLRRFLGRSPPGQGAGQLRMRTIETLALSDESRAYLIEIDRRPMLVVESTRHVTLQDANLLPGAGVRPQFGSGGIAPRRGFGAMR